MRLTFLLLTSLWAVPTFSTLPAAEQPLARWRVTVDLGRDLGQNFGSLLEVRDKAGRLVAGAGFMEAYNTRFRGDRHTLQFFVRPLKGHDEFRIERLPHPDMDCGIYLFDVSQVLYAWTGARANRVKRWDASQRKWVPEGSRPNNLGGLGSGDGAMRIGKGLLIFRGSQARLGNFTVLEPPAQGRYYNFYYARGRLFFFHTVRDKPGFTRISACPWDPADKKPVDLSKATILQTKYVGETPFAWGQYGSEVMTVTNQGGIHAFDGRRWRTLQEPNNKVSYQVYSMLNYYNRMLMAQYPTGHLFDFRGGSEVRHLEGWPPRLPGVSARAREAQTTAIYRGEMFTGVWPWAELWRYHRDDNKWTSMGRAFTHPELTDKQTHPYEQHTDRFKIVTNHWGQRITGMIPIGDSLFLSTSSKGTYEWHEKYDFLTDKQRREYGAVLKLTMPGNVAASIRWTGKPLVLDFLVLKDRIAILQDGREIGTSRLADGGGHAFDDTSVGWGKGIFGPLNGGLLSRSPDR